MDRFVLLKLSNLTGLFFNYLPLRAIELDKVINDRAKFRGQPINLHGTADSLCRQRNDAKVVTAKVVIHVVRRLLKRDREAFRPQSEPELIPDLAR